MTDVEDRKTRERRTLTVSGRRTTISLEQEIWRSLGDIAEREKLALSLLVEQVDRRREDASLASGLRVFCLYYWRLLWQARLGPDGEEDAGDDAGDAAEPSALFQEAITQMSQGGRHRSLEAQKSPRGRFGKPV
jgi:predicted DNA-binding ribbon-helix-helix protein